MNLQDWFNKQKLHYIVFDYDGTIVTNNLADSGENDATSLPTNLKELFDAESCASLLSSASNEQFRLNYIDPKSDTQSVNGSILYNSQNIKLLVLDLEDIDSTTMYLFVKRLAHDLKNPIGIASSNLELLLTLIESGAAQDKLIEVTNRAITSLKSGIKLIDLAKKSLQKQSTDKQDWKSILPFLDFQLLEFSLTT